MEHIKELLAKNPAPEMSLKEILSTYDHIELTEDEMDLAIIEAKRKKESSLKMAEIRRLQDENRKNLMQTSWSYEQTKGFMLHRARTIFQKEFDIDPENTTLFDLLCYYFSSDKMFEEVAANMGVKNPSLSKGLFIAGGVGIGKTWLMKLFCKNKRQVFFIRNAKEIAQEYMFTKPSEIPPQYLTPFVNPANDTATFYQPISGLCIDDIGTEDTKNSYGNKANVIGDLIELRYAKGYTGELLHANTNLNSNELRDYYGDRVVSRMREIFNYIVFQGKDRRK